MAVNCWVEFKGMVLFAGVTAIETSAAAVTVSTVDPVTPLSIEVIVVVLAPTPEAKPPVVMVATEVTVEPQVTDWVRTCVVPSA
jgi:hypothetical protein